jgi:cytochrome c-type biogenesis protein CcmH/NrfG
MRNFTGAILAYNQALKLTPHNDDPLYNKALALIGVAIQKVKPDFETLREALKYFDNVLGINPQDKNAAYFRTLLMQILTKYAPNMMTSGTR